MLLELNGETKFKMLNMGFIYRLINRKKIKSEVSVIFDKDWYARNYLDATYDRSKAWKHFAKKGCFLGYDPSVFFDSDWYIYTNEVTLKSGDNPLSHYLRIGWKLGYDPSPQFSTSYYLTNNPDVKKSGINPLIHFVRFGYLEGRHPYLSYWPDSAWPWKVASILNRPEFSSKNKKSNAVLIPVFNNWQFTERCIQAIFKTTDSNLFDVYILNDCSTDSTNNLLEYLNNVHIINTPYNVGFTKACNFAFEKLKDYEFIYLLNNDTEVQEGFFKHCMEIMKINELSGIVGSTLHYSDGAIQSCGAIVWNDATVSEFGVRSNPSGIEFSFSRQVDFCAGAGILIRTDALIKVNYFDEIYAPAYYEDTDLAFKMRKAGYETWVSNESRVIHHGGVTYGRDEKSGVKNLVSLNQQKFRNKWHTELAEFSETTKDNIKIFQNAMRWTSLNEFKFLTQ